MDITRSPLFPQPVNDFGQVVGDFTLRGPSVGFLYDAGTVRTDLVTGSLRFSYLGGINDTDQFTGSVVTPDGALEAILISHGVLQAFTYPGSTATEGHGINNWGQVVGDYTDAGGTHGLSERLTTSARSMCRTDRTPSPMRSTTEGRLPAPTRAPTAISTVFSIL